MNVKIKSIDIVDDDYKLMKKIVESILDKKERTNSTEFYFSVEIETDDEDLLFFVDGFISYDEEEENGQYDTVFQHVNIENIVANYNGQDVDFEIIAKGKIQDIEQYIKKQININC